MRAALLAVCKQWKRAAAAVKLSGQTLETEPHVSCGGYSWIADGYDDEDEDYDAAMGPCASTISALPDNNLLVADTNNGRILMLTPDGERLYELFVPGEYPARLALVVKYCTSRTRQDCRPARTCRRTRSADDSDCPTARTSHTCSCRSAITIARSSVNFTCRRARRQSALRTPVPSFALRAGPWVHRRVRSRDA